MEQLWLFQQNLKMFHGVQLTSEGPGAHNGFIISANVIWYSTSLVKARFIGLMVNDLLKVEACDAFQAFLV